MSEPVKSNTRITEVDNVPVVQIDYRYLDTIHPGGATCALETDAFDAVFEVREQVSIGIDRRP